MTNSVPVQFIMQVRTNNNGNNDFKNRRKKVLIPQERQTAWRRRSRRRIKKIQNNIVFYFVITVYLQYRPLYSVGYSISLRYFQTLQFTAQSGRKRTHQTSPDDSINRVHSCRSHQNICCRRVYDMSTIYTYMQYVHSIHTHTFIHTQTHASCRNTEYVIHIILHAARAFVNERGMKRFSLDIKATTH